MVHDSADPKDAEDLQQLFRQEAEAIVERLELLLDAGTGDARAEALRLAHTLKGLAASMASGPLRDLARSLEAALARPDVAGSTTERLSGAIDAARGLLADAVDAPAAARRIAAELEAPPTVALEVNGLPAARSALLGRFFRRLPPLWRSCAMRLDGLEAGGRDNWRARGELAREVELLGAAVGLLGQAQLSALLLEASAFLSTRSPTPQALEAARSVFEEARSLGGPRALETLDQPVAGRALATLGALRASGRPRPEEARVAVPVELPWPDVDQPLDLLRRLERLAAGQVVLDARPSRSSVRFLRGTLGLAPLRRSGGRTVGGFLRVPRRRLDRLLNLSERLVSSRGRAQDLARRTARAADTAPPNARLQLRRLARQAEEHDRELEHLVRTTQEAVLRARLMSARGLLALARMTAGEHLARHPEKLIQVTVQGATTEVDKGTLDALIEPVLHLVRNALTHGIEPSAERAAGGKRPEAKLRLAASAGPGGVTIEVEDDGRGLPDDLQEVGPDLVLLGDERDEGASLAFAAGVSSAERVTDESGRGMGLASVLERVRSLRGRLAVRSTPGRGTLVRLVIPPAATTARVLLVRAGRERYALPLASVKAVEQVDARVGADPQRVRLVDLVGKPPVPERRQSKARPGRERRQRDQFAVRLTPLFSEAGSHDASEGEHTLALVVDDVLRRDLTVIRPLGRRFAFPGIDGVAQLGDGRLVLVLDVWRLYLARSAPPTPWGGMRVMPPVHRGDDG